MPSTTTDIGADTEIRVKDLTRIEDFLRTGKCKHEYQGGAVLRDKADDPFLCRDGEFIELSTNDTRGDDNEIITFVTGNLLSAAPEHRNAAYNYNDDYVELLAGVAVPGGPKGWKNILIACGDEDYGQLCVEVKDGTPAVTISFLCLSRFLDDAEPLKLAAMLHSGRIKVLDFTTDETRKVSAADRKKHNDRKPVLPPEPGFTYMDNEDGPAVWHRAATVLLKSGRMRILLGQDDGTYFGCELKGTPGTIKEAFKSLMPEHIRKVRGVKRQGEWFVVPVADKNVPAITECVALSDEGIDLPVDDKDSARHTVCSTDIRVAKDGRIYTLAGTLRHSEDDHPVVAMPNKWHTFDRNTAKRSFSQEGVD